MNRVDGRWVQRLTSILGWIAIGLSLLILFVFATIRFVDMMQGSSPTDAFGVRYIEHPWIALLHIVPGLLFLVLAPFQFVSRFRRRHLRLHRRLGWLLVPCVIISGLFALVAAFRFPAYGGMMTQTATLCFGVLFLFSVGKAIYHIRRKQVRLHREWMIRLFAVGLGVATIRLFIGLSLALFSVNFEDVFGVSFWLGLSVNLLIAEGWIRYTRSPVLTS
jgi:uncharacterized membrane protein